MHVLTIRYPDGSTIEVHPLNVGEMFPHFGGSSRGLCVGEGQKGHRRTASIVTRATGMSQVDCDREIFDETFWKEIARLINGGTEGATAEIPKR